MRSLRMPAAILIGVVWALAFVDGILTQDFTALEVIMPAVIIVVGSLFVIRNGNGKDG